MHRPGGRGRLALALAIGGDVLAAVPALAVALDRGGDGAGALRVDGDAGVGAVAGLRPRGLEEVVGDRRFVVRIDQGAVALAGRAQLLVGAAGGHAAVVEEDDLVGERDRGLAVGDQQQRGRGHLAADPVEDRQLHRRVAGAGRVVQDQQPGPAREGAGQGDALALPAGERSSALPQLGVEAVGQGVDEALGLGHAQRPADRRLVDVLAEGDVLAHGVVEDEGLLEHQRDIRGQGVGREGAQVGAVHGDGALVGVHEPGGEQGEGGFAGAGGADDGQHARAGARIGAQRDPVQRRGGAQMVLGSCAAAEDDLGGVVAVDERDLVEGEHAGALG